MRHLSVNSLPSIADGVCPMQIVLERGLCGNVDAGKLEIMHSFGIHREDEADDYDYGHRGLLRENSRGGYDPSKVVIGAEKTRLPSDHSKCKLPPEVVERILAMIPFPHLFKIRSLSRTWYNKLPFPFEISGEPWSRFPSPKLKLKVNDDSPLSFQNLVSSFSTNWSVYCPVILGDEGLIGYDPVCKRWQRVLFLTDLHRLIGTTWEPSLISSCGSLMCGVSQSPNSNYDVLVTNVLTRRWRKLPSHPNKRIPSLVNLVFDGLSGYKVFLVTEDPYDGPHDASDYTFDRLRQRCICTQIFDSRDDTWTFSNAKFPVATSFAWRSCSVYFNGKFYCLSGDDRNPVDHPLQVWFYSMEESTWTEIVHPFARLVSSFSGRSVLFDLTRFNLFVCGSKIMVVLALDPKHHYKDRVGTDTLFIFELDPETHVITEKSRGPPTTVSANSEHMASDGSNIYFCTLDLLICYPVVVFNVKSGEWTCLAPDFKTAWPLTNKRWADFTFQPGLNPFQSV